MESKTLSETLTETKTGPAQVHPARPGQTQAVIQQAGRRMAIRSRHGPAVRLLGFVDSIDDPTVYAGLGEVRMHPTGAWKLLADAPCDDENEIAIVRATLDAYVADIDDGKVEFEERCDYIRTHNALPDDAPVNPEDTSVNVEEAIGTRQCNPAAAPVHERRGQQFAALGVVNHAQGVLVLPLGAHDSEAACNEWIRETLADRYPAFDIMCVQMYEWVFPHTLRERRCTAAIPFRYGGVDGDRLTELMQYQVDEETKADTFTTTMQARGLDEGTYVTELGV